MADVKVTLSLDVAGAKSTLLVPALTVAAVDRVSIKLPKAPSSGTPTAHVVKAAPAGVDVQLLLITSGRYDIAGKGVRLLKTATDTTGIPLEAPLFVAGAGSVSAAPVQASELRLVNDSTTEDITVEILVGRNAE